MFNFYILYSLRLTLLAGVSFFIAVVNLVDINATLNRVLER